MNQQLYNIAQKLGMDKAIAYSSGSRIVQGLTGVLSVFFIALFLSGVEQGFYYTFGSILAMQFFLELGLSFIMTQFVAHEASHLTLNDRNEYTGEEKYVSRLASLIHFCIKWYTILSLLLFVFLLVVGFLYFNRFGKDHLNIDWEIPWILICLGTAAKLFQSPFSSILMGLDKVKEMSKIGFYQQIILPLFMWVGLACGWKLYVVGIGSILSAVLWQFYVYHTGLQKIIVGLWRKKITDNISYIREIFPYHWRIAISSISGYFIFQLFNPVLFATEGPVVAGQMGMTLSALSAIQGFSISWLNTKIPLYSKLIALKDYFQLDILFNKTLKQMTSICFLLLVLFFVVIVFLNVTKLRIGQNILADRFLPYVPMLLLMLSVYLQQYTNSWATYLRCHKQEPFMVISIIVALADGLSTIILGKLYGLYGITIGYTVIAVVFFPWGYKIFKSKKEQWHQK